MAYISTELVHELEVDSIITVHYFEYTKNFVFHGESHDFWEFLYVDKGSLSVTADDRSYLMNAGDILFHKPNEFHAMKSLGDKPPNLVAISFLSSSPEIFFFRDKMFSLSLDERKIISLIISEAREAFQTPLHLPTVEQVIPSAHAAFGAQQLVNLYLELLLITLRRNYAASADESNASSKTSFLSMESSPASKRLEQIIVYMNSHICEQITIAQICSEFSVSRSTLQSIFHKEKNCGAMEYFNKMKIESAKEFMRDGMMNLTEIAHYLSYSSLQYFSKQFKKSTGMSPNEYVSSVKGISQAIGKAASLNGKQP